MHHFISARDVETSGDVLRSFIRRKGFKCNGVYNTVPYQGSIYCGEGAHHCHTVKSLARVQFCSILGEWGSILFLRHDFQSKQMTTFGCYQHLGCFSAFIISTIFDEKAFSNDVLIQSFNHYLAPSEGQVATTKLLTQNCATTTTHSGEKKTVACACKVIDATTIIHQRKRHHQDWLLFNSPNLKGETHYLSTQMP